MSASLSFSSFQDLCQHVSGAGLEMLLLPLTFNSAWMCLLLLGDFSPQSVINTQLIDA